jgi:hypothetical protein
MRNPEVDGERAESATARLAEASREHQAALIAFGRSIEACQDAGFDLWTWLPSYRAAKAAHGDYASEHQPPTERLLQEAAVVLARLSGYVVSDDDEASLLACPCGCEQVEPSRVSEADKRASTRLAVLLDPDSCLHHSSDDEPVFVLCARDAVAPSAVEYWADRVVSSARSSSARSSDKTEAARHVAREMCAWASKHGSKIPD